MGADRGHSDWSSRERNCVLCIDTENEGVDGRMKKVGQHHVSSTDHQPELGQSERRAS